MFRRRNGRLTIGVVIGISLLFSRPAPSQAVAGVAFGVLLNRLTDQLQQVIEAARNAGLSLEIEAGRQANLAIENAKNAYAASLDLTMDRVDASAKKTLDQLSSMVNDISNNAFGNLDQITLRAQQIVNSLPFRKHQPQLTAVKPRFVVPAAQPYPVVVNIGGNFEFASRAGFTPSLEVRGQTFIASENTTQSLKFVIPVTAVFPQGSSGDTKKFSYAVATLKAPWQEGTVFKRRREDQYKILIGALPESPGKVVLRCTTTHKETRFQSFESPEFYQSSGSDGANDDHKDVPYDVVPRTGWHVVRNSVAFNTKPGTEGDWGRTFVSDAGDHVTYRVTTIHHGLGTSGRVRFTISFRESQEYDVPDVREEEVALKWGDSMDRSCVGTARIIFDGFDGSHAEFPGPDLNNPFLKIRAPLTIATADAKSLVWP